MSNAANNAKLDVNAMILAGQLQEFKAGDTIEIDFEGGRRSRKVQVTSVRENLPLYRECPGVYVTSGNVRCGHMTGGVVEFLRWGGGEVVFQPTPQQAPKRVLALRKIG